MAQIIIEVGDLLPQITEAILARRNYQTRVPDQRFPSSGGLVDNPELPSQFVVRMGFEYYRNEVLAYAADKSSLATKAAVDAAHKRFDDVAKKGKP